MEENPYESPRSEIGQRKSFRLGATMRGWILGGLAGAAFGFVFINPLASHFPSDEVRGGLVALGALIGGMISRLMTDCKQQVNKDSDQAGQSG
jgi:hypothetical protein